MKRKAFIPLLWKETEEARWSDGPQNHVQKKTFYLGKMKREVERIRGGGREDETARSLCWCDGGLVLSWSSDGEQSARCGHGWTTGALHECSLFLTWGKEMLMFTLTTSRLYNVNVKLHRRVQSHPPGLYTSFIYILKNTVLTCQHWYFCLFILCKKDIQRAPHRWTFKSSRDHTNLDNMLILKIKIKTINLTLSRFAWRWINLTVPSEQGFIKWL